MDTSKLLRRLSCQAFPYVQYGRLSLLLFPSLFLIEEIEDPFGGILCLRLVVALLSAFMIFHELIKNTLIKNLLFCITISLSLNILPLIFVVQTLTPIFLLNFFLSLVLLVLVSNWLMFLINIMVSIGALCAVHGFCIDHARTLFFGFFMLSLIVFFIVRANEVAHDKISKVSKSLAGFMAHELRGSLSAIHLSTCQVCHDVERERIKRLSLQGLKTIDNLLQKVGVDDFKMKLSRCCLNEVVEEVLTTPPYAGKTKVAKDTFCKKVYVKVDRVCFAHVLSNLIKNGYESVRAAKKGEVCLSLKEENNHLFLCIKDTGLGLPEAKKDLVFKEFYSDKVLGSGLGLHFVKRALVLMGHDICVDSVEGKFTMMNVCFGAYDA